MYAFFHFLWLYDCPVPYIFRDIEKWENSKDLGIKPAHGLPPPKLSVKEASSADEGW